jgi:hypothetical protein
MKQVRRNAQDRQVGTQADAEASDGLVATTDVCRTLKEVDHTGIDLDAHRQRAKTPDDPAGARHAPWPMDLRTRFGDHYRIGWEASGSTRSGWPKSERSWLLELRCRYGIVYPYGGEILAAWTDRPRIGAKLRALACVLRARGDAETVVTFHVNDAEAVFRILKPYRRRRLSDAQRLRNIENLARARQRRESLTQRDFATPESTKSGQDSHRVHECRVHLRALKSHWTRTVSVPGRATVCGLPDPDIAGSLTCSPRSSTSTWSDWPPAAAACAWSSSRDAARALRSRWRERAGGSLPCVNA